MLSMEAEQSADVESAGEISHSSFELGESEPGDMDDQSEDLESSADVGHTATLASPLWHLVGSKDILPEILRGAQMTTVLQSWGSLWRTSPVDIPYDLWYKTEACESLDAFISQSWASPGWQKHLALLMHFYWAPPATVGVAILFVFMLIDGLGWLPTLDPIREESFGLGTSVPGCPWSMIPPTTVLVVLCLSPYLPGLPDRKVFVDALCINQVDEGLKSQGIYSIGGFVASSKDFIMLWCPGFFHRGWCVLELAVCAASDTTCALHFCPLFAATTWLTGYIMCLLLNVLLSVADYLCLVLWSAQISWMCMLLSVLPVFAFVHMSRLRALSIRKLSAQLEQFSLDDAKCRFETDLDFIRKHITALHGSPQAFENYVRGSLKERIVDSRHSYDLSYASVVIMVFPLSVYSLQRVISLTRTGMPMMSQVNLMAAHGSAVLFFLPSLVKLIGVVSSGFAQPRRNLLLDVACSMCIALVTCGLAAGACVTIKETAYRYSWGGLVAFGIGALIACLAFQPWRLQHFSGTSSSGAAAPAEVKPPHVTAGANVQDENDMLDGEGSLPLQAQNQCERD